MTAIWLNSWATNWKGEPIDGLQQLKEDFGISDTDLEGVEIVLATYSYENYEGDAFVLFRKDGKLYEVNGSHCSCYGLSESSYSGSYETQWKPEETTIEALQIRKYLPLELKPLLEKMKEETA